jgi:ADP-ribose pyrophosphatase YjhB (NUDIX family)
LPWRRLDSRRLADCGVFEVDAVRYEPPGGGPAPTFYALRSTDWVNVIPLTADRRVLLVRQYRFGIDGFTLEIPGGMCDPDEDPSSAARRELLEETGHESPEIVELGWVHPNPAIQTNRCWCYLARDVVHTRSPRPDPHEAFEQCSVPLDEIPGLIRTRRITHALVVAAFQLLGTS